MKGLNTWGLFIFLSGWQACQLKSFTDGENSTKIYFIAMLSAGDEHPECCCPADRH
jgi:hypothetical protein